MDINYHLFFALAVLIFNATWSKQCGKVQKCTFKVQKYTFKVQDILSKYKIYFQSTKFIKILHSKSRKHTFKLQNYTFKVQKYTFKVQSHFRNLGIGISGTRNLLNTSGSRTPGSRTGSVQTSGIEPNPSNPSNTETFETSRTQPSEPGTLAIPRVRNPVSRNQFPEPGSFPEPPQLAQNTPKSILCKDPIAFCCWGKNTDTHTHTHTHTHAHKKKTFIKYWIIFQSSKAVISHHSLSILNAMNMKLALPKKNLDLPTRSPLRHFLLPCGSNSCARCDKACPMALKSFGAETPNLAKDQAAIDKCCAYRRVGSDESHGRLWEGATSGDFVVYEMARFERKKKCSNKKWGIIEDMVLWKRFQGFFSKTSATSDICNRWHAYKCWNQDGDHKNISTIIYISYKYHSNIKYT